jgi:hypothetical protein
MAFYCRDTFLGTNGIVPQLDTDAIARITHGLRVQYMFETNKKSGRWGIVDVPEALIDECAGRIFAKVIVRRPLQTEEIIRAEAARKAMEEAAQKAREEVVRKAGEDARRLEEALWNEQVRRQATALRKVESVTQMKARFSSLSELCADIASRGRDPFVADLANNHGSTNYNTGIHEGVIYAIICRVDLNIYVGQTFDVGERMCSHFSGQSSNSNLTSALNKYGRENFVSVILLADIGQQEELDSAEIAVIKCLASDQGYNIAPGGRGGSMLMSVAEFACLSEGRASREN